MIRKLAMAMVVSGALGSSYANALGLGEIKLNSALNQPLDAEVKLLNVGDLSKNEILPNLASHDDFSRAGVERVFFLTGIKFDVELDGKGGAVVHLTTDRIVREPFLNFLIELHWPSGRLLREYTALLDPPLFSEAPPAPVQQSATVTPPPKVESAPETQAPQTQSYSAPSVSQTTPQPAPSQVASEKKDGTVRVKKNDTLWGIAKENRPDRSVTVRQTMVAIQQHNPHAFIKNNINLLKSGQVLRIPEVEEIRQVSSREAYAETARQNEEWQGKKTIDATQKYSAPTSGSSTSDESGLVKLVATEKDVDSESGAESAATGSASQGDTSGGSTDGVASGTGSSTSEDVEALQKQLDDLQRLLTLKQEQLALLQATQAEEEAALAAAAETESAGATETELAEAAEKTAASGEQVVTEVPAATVETKEAITAEPSAAEAPAVPATAEVPTSPEKAAAEQPRPKEGIIDILLNNPLYIGVLVVVILGALILLGTISRRRKEEQEYEAVGLQSEIDSSANNVDIPDDLSDELVDVGTEASKTNLADAEPILSEEGAEGSGDDTRKLLDESDIFIAYGRYERAIEILQPAVNAAPENTELRLKLAETYLLNNDEARFSQQEADLQAIGDTSALGALDELKTKYSATLDSGDKSDDFATPVEEAVEPKNEFLADADVQPESGAAEDELSFDIDEALDTEQESSELADLEFELPEEETLSEETAVEEESHDNLVDFDSSSEDNFLDIEEDSGAGDQELEFNLDEDVPAKNDADSVNADDLDFLVDTDESATKLELAKAYIDMADAEAAQEILNEVLSDGSDEQQQEARKLLDNLG